VGGVKIMGAISIQVVQDCSATDIIDYQLLSNILVDYKKPRDKISHWIKTEKIIRIRKGLYILGKKYRREPIYPEIIANLISGPSYVSLEYALAYYGMIPERVECVTSIILGRAKLFHTPLGTFSYSSLTGEKYAIGITRKEIAQQRYCLIASKEKALSDLVAKQRKIESEKHLEEYLFEDMRIDQEVFMTLRKSNLSQISKAYNKHNVRLLYNLRKDYRYE
jgi:hypothetical protein